MIDTDPLIETYKILQRLKDGTITLRQIERLTTINNVATWRMKQEVKKNSHQLIQEKELNKIAEAIYEIIFDKFCTLYGTQNIKNKPVLRALLWEVSVDICVNQSYDLRLLNGDLVPTELVERIVKNIALGLRGGNVQPKTVPKRLNEFEIDGDTVAILKKTVCDDIGHNQIDFYKKNILSLLETTEDRIRVVLDEIKTICEFDTVAAAIENCLYLSELPKRNRSAIQEEKRKFERAKERARKALKVLNLPNDIVDQAKFEHYEEWQNYESTLKHIKAVLYDELTLICGTGKARAKNIVKILEYI